MEYYSSVNHLSLFSGRMFKSASLYGEIPHTESTWSQGKQTYSL